MQQLEAEGELERDVEFLPDDRRDDGAPRERSRA